MKLSEAIRLGAMSSPQGFGATEHIRLVERETRFFGTITAEVVERCALGAAIFAEGCQTVSHVQEDTRAGFRGVIAKGEVCQMVMTPDEWPLHAVRECPTCPSHDFGADFKLRAPLLPLYRLIPHLNDFHKWTREQIAEFVDTVEREMEKTEEAVALHIREMVRAAEPVTTG